MYTALMAVGCLFGCLCFTCLYNALTYFYRMQAAGGSAGTYQAGSSEAVEKFEAEMMAYTDFWWAGVVIFHSLEQSFLTATSLQVCVVFVLIDRPTAFLCSRSRVSDSPL